MLLATLLAALALPASAQNHADAHAHHAAANTSDMDIPHAAQAAVDVIERFDAALASGNLEAVGALLDPDVLILESGGAERSREEYLGHHAVSDAAFLGKAHRQIKRRKARVDGDTAWVGTESELHVTKDGKASTLSSTETMVLGRTADGWRIVHIHWSSRTKR